MSLFAKDELPRKMASTSTSEKTRDGDRENSSRRVLPNRIRRSGFVIPFYAYNDAAQRTRSSSSRGILYMFANLSSLSDEALSELSEQTAPFTSQGQ